jgi:hypothetical protein
LTAQTAPAPSEIFNETASTGDAWIRQRKKPMWAVATQFLTHVLINFQKKPKIAKKQ